MRKYYDAQGNVTGTSQGGQGAIGQGCLAVIGIALLVFAVAMIATAFH